MIFRFAVEQVKGSPEMREKIITAARDARLHPDYPQELLPEHLQNEKNLQHHHHNNTAPHYQVTHIPLPQNHQHGKFYDRIQT